jgi:hypothetical protein
MLLAEARRVALRALGDIFGMTLANSNLADNLGFILAHPNTSVAFIIVIISLAT